MPPKGKRVTASEIGQYAFCARAWWFRTVEKLEPLNVVALDRGTAAHEQHGWQVVLARGLRKLAFVLLGLFALLIIAWGVTRLLV
ncbi:MAG: hypothetical protein JXA89_17455 [Anaerolineae bacterium]|nr:hypothetical protein [Anaerolineae bacterium]